MHLPAFIQTIANDILLKRLYSVAMPWPMLVASYAYALLLVGAYATVLVRVLRGSTSVGPLDFLLVVLPVPVGAGCGSWSTRARFGTTSSPIWC